MKKNTIIYFIIAVGSVILVPGGKTKADNSSTGLTFVYQEQTFLVSKQDLNSWQGQETFSTNNALATAPIPLEDALLKFLGQAPKQQSSILTYNYHLRDIYNYLQTLAPEINQDSIEPSLQIQDNRATSFTPPQTGRKVDVYKSAIAALRNLELDKSLSPLTVYETPPQTSLTQTNSLGINELIAHGVSNFSGSPNNRRHNIAVGLEKFKGIIIAPGQEFSFNQFLGPVDAESGFLPELVIKANDTIPEFGGGLCQVSTTTFRAAMQAGLPITQRKNHAYAVKYYSPQGTDATIYPGSADLKFVNNTPGAILIWPYEKDKNTLIYDFYGSNDGRQVTLEKPVVYDRQTDGSMKATWTRVVTAQDGTPRTDVFKSVYLPPALFHHEEKFVVAPTPTPASNNPQKQLQ